jgi:hypothetical protein
MGAFDTLGRRPQMGGMLPGLGQNSGMGRIRTGGMLPGLGDGAGMNSSAGRGAYRSTGTPSPHNSFDYIAWRNQTQAPKVAPKPPAAAATPQAITFGGPARAATTQAIPQPGTPGGPVTQPGPGTPWMPGQPTPPTVPEIKDTSEAIINRGTEEIAESEREAMRNATANAAAAGVSNAGDLQRGQQRMQSQYAGMRANLARDVRQQQADRETELAKWKAELEERRRQFDASLAAQNQNNSGGGGGGRGGSGGTDWTQDINDFMGGKSPQLQIVSRGRNREGARNKNAEQLADVQSRFRNAPLGF